eukprot:PhF_6_TR29158/c1_g1_i2/m.42622
MGSGCTTLTQSHPRTVRDDYNHNKDRGEREGDQPFQLGIHLINSNNHNNESEDAQLQQQQHQQHAQSASASVNTNDSSLNASANGSNGSSVGLMNDSTGQQVVEQQQQQQQQSNESIVKPSTTSSSPSSILNLPPMKFHSNVKPNSQNPDDSGGGSVYTSCGSIFPLLGGGVGDRETTEEDTETRVHSMERLRRGEL